MNLPVETVLRPRDLGEALSLLAEDPSAVPVAGGTDLVVQLRARRRHAPVLVDIGALGLDRIAVEGNALVIGAAATMDAIARSAAVREHTPALATAAGQVGAWPIQCRATLGGNLANASPAADTAPPLLTAGATVTAAFPSGQRRIPVLDLFEGPGTTRLAPGELITSVSIPLDPVPAGARRVDRFLKLGPRREQIISVVSLALRATLLADGALADVRIAVGAAAPTPVRAPAAESVLEDRPPGGAARREAARALQEDIAPIDDIRATARYRRLAAAVSLDRLLGEISHG